jgi:nucleotide-binding universal stress UspA family protein
VPRKRTLLVPVDGSACSLRALAYACRRLRGDPFDALVVLNVQPPLPSGRIVTRQMVREHHEKLAEEALAPARKLAAREKIRARFVTAVASPAAAIVRLAKRSRGDEIVMGTRGRGGVAGLLLGSTAMKVVQLAEVPVTLVK